MYSRFFRFALSFSILILGFISSTYSQTAIPKPQYIIKAYRDTAFLGDITIELFPLIAPKHVANFDSLVQLKLYDSTAFHRVVPGFVIQGGDPNSKNKPRNTWGQGDPSQQTIEAEFSKIAYQRGIIGAARSNDINSATSQFFICVAAARNLDNTYTAYGRVVAGMPVADNIVRSAKDANDNPLQKIIMLISPIAANTSIPEAPLLLQPLDSTTNVGIARTLSWQAISDAVLYKIEVAQHPNFTDSTLSIGISGITTFKAANLQPNTRYYWRVKSNNGGAESAYSAVRTFSTAASAAAEQLTEMESYIHVSTTTADVWNDLLTFNAQVNDNGRALFELFDITGKRIWAERLIFEKGTNTHSVTTDNLWTGIYLYKYTFKGLEVSGRCMIGR